MAQFDIPPYLRPERQERLNVAEASAGSFEFLSHRQIVDDVSGGLRVNAPFFVFIYKSTLPYMYKTNPNQPNPTQPKRTENAVGWPMRSHLFFRRTIGRSRCWSCMATRRCSEDRCVRVGRREAPPPPPPLQQPLTPQQ